MAAKMFAEVVIAGSYKNLSKSTRGAKQELTGFEKHAKAISGAVKGAMAGIALLGIGQVFDALKDMTKAAAQDAKSTALLNKQMDNTWHATKATKDQMAGYLDTVSNMSGILDDDLRPALSKIVGVTKSSTKAQKYFSMAMDISAGTGKDVNTVSQAFAKYLGGNKTALDKLVPGLKNATDKMGFLQDKYKGMAAVAGNNDPFARISVVMDNFKEKLGTAFLPVVQKFADWLASGESQKALDDIAKKVQKFGEWFASPEGQKAFKGWMKDLKILIELVGKFLDLVGKTTELLSSSGTHRLDTKASLSGTNIMTGAKVNAVTKDNASSWAGVGQAIQSVVINVTATQASGKDVVTALTNYARGKGIPMSKLLK